MKRTFRATVTPGRQSLCTIFFHPCRSDESGKPKRVRYGLGTPDKEVAATIVADLNAILSDQTLWNLEARQLAAKKFNPVAVDLFYDEIQPRIVDPWSRREEFIPLLKIEDGVPVILIVGPTGSGKTTLIRQIGGTDPITERFPSTSPSRTTIFDTEIVCQAGDYQAVVSFLPESRVRSYIEECLFSAVAKAAEGVDEDGVQRSLLIHNEERFRLSYVLGNVPKKGATEEDDDGDEPMMVEEDNSSEISDGERAENVAKIQSWTMRCIQIANGLVKELKAELGEESTGLTDKDRDAFLQLVEEKLRDSEEAYVLIDELLDEVKDRFSFVNEGEMLGLKDGWPTLWTLKSSDRQTFLRSVRRFAGNSATSFGRLLTPLVDGLRVKGPFAPKFGGAAGEVRPLVLLDGEGIGHVRSTSAQVPTSVSRRYSLASTIALVDSATSPMQAGAQALLRSVTSSGHEQKLAIVFTHVDQMKGPNFRTAEDKRESVLASLEQAIQGVDEALDLHSGAGRKLRKRLSNHVFFVGGIDQVLSEKRPGTIKAIDDLLVNFRESVRPAVPTTAVPVYDLMHLVLGLRAATEQFQQHWNARLGLGHHEGIPSEHWTRIQALSRRFAFQSDDKYRDLQPAAHLLALLLERLALFIATPRSWDPAGSTLEERDAATARVSQALQRRLDIFVQRRLREDHLREWNEAFSRRGSGSGRIRSRDIRSIYEDVAPVPGETPSPLSSRLLDDIRDLFKAAAAEAGARIAAS